MIAELDDEMSAKSRSYRAVDLLILPICESHSSIRLVRDGTFESMRLSSEVVRRTGVETCPLLVDEAKRWHITTTSSWVVYVEVDNWM